MAETAQRLRKFNLIFCDLFVYCAHEIIYMFESQLLIIALNRKTYHEMSTPNDLEKEADRYFEQSREAIYNAIQTDTDLHIDDATIHAVYEAIAIASEFPRLIPKSYELLLFVEEAFSVSKRRAHWLKIYTKMCYATINTLEADSEIKNKMLQHLFTKAGSAMAVHIENNKAIELLNQAINYGLDVQSSEWFLAKAAFIETSLHVDSLEETVENCHRLLKMARVKRNQEDTLDNDKRAHARQDYAEAALYIYMTLAFAYQFHGRQYQAFIAAQQAFVLAHRLKRIEYLLLTAPYMIEYYHRHDKRIDLAEEITTYCLDQEIPIYAYRAKARLHVTVAANHYCQERYSRAEMHYEHALHLTYDMRDPRLLASVHHGYGQTLIESGAFDDAFDYLQKAISAYKQIGLHLHEYDIDYAIAWLYFRQGHHAKAIAALEKLKAHYAMLADKELRESRLKSIDNSINEILTDKPK